ncbi:MAG TPA: type II toxin-antitoxin system PemK/MazF family toxin [Stellaceae bacterium]|nr:type II toxin-antitoxin system PemK/MazF family toxin [Stellaceae bacterium]
MRRGDVVTVALPGDYGKPRPALIIQSDLFETTAITLLPITSHLEDLPLLRVGIGPEAGLQQASQIQVDKPQTPRRGRIGRVIGRADETTMRAVNRALIVFIGLA